MPHVWLTPHQPAESLHFIGFLDSTPMTQRPHIDTTATCRWSSPRLASWASGVPGRLLGKERTGELGSHHWKTWKMERHLFCIKTFAHPFCFAAVFWSPQSSWIFKMLISPWSGQQTYFCIKSKLKTASIFFQDSSLRGLGMTQILNNRTVWIVLYWSLLCEGISGVRKKHVIHLSLVKNCCNSFRKPYSSGMKSLLVFRFPFGFKRKMNWTQFDMKCVLILWFFGQTRKWIEHNLIWIEIRTYP